MPIDPRDLELLRTVADYRVLTIRQLATVQDRFPKAVHCSVDRLVDKELLEKSPRAPSRRRGQRESLVSVASSGFNALLQSEALPADAKEVDVLLAGLPHIEHQLLLNWVRIQWCLLDGLFPSLRTRFVPHSSPTARYDAAEQGTGAGPVPITFRPDCRRDFTPDAVATIVDVERSKTVLFFVEVDRGTEPRDLSGKPRPTISGKIEHYQRYFRTGGYRDYQAVWQCRLRGFRVLFVVNTPKRFTSLCHLLDSVRSREFIWITDEKRLLDQGIGAHIWARGGHRDQPAASILGSRAPGGSSVASSAPLPPG